MAMAAGSCSTADRFPIRVASPSSADSRGSTLCEAHVSEYARRGFESLTVSFGCTGGQHRSVYFVERLATHLRGVFPNVVVRVHHRERPYWPGSDGQGG